MLSIIDILCQLHPGACLACHVNPCWSHYWLDQNWCLIRLQGTGSLDQPWLPRSARASPKLDSQEAPPGQRKIQKGLGDGNFVQVLDLPMPKSARLRKALDVFAATSHAKLGNGIPWCLGGHTWHPWACQMVCCSCNWKAAHGGTLTDTSWHTIHDY